jgi:isopenicillin N synthase-like dioxygenase
MSFTTGETIHVYGQQKSPVVPLKIVDMDKLIRKDPDTMEDLLQAAESPGFFYVDLRGAASKDLLADVEALFRLSHEYFAQPKEAKEPHFRASIDRGYVIGIFEAIDHTVANFSKDTSPRVAMSLLRHHIPSTLVYKQD